MVERAARTLVENIGREETKLRLAALSSHLAIRALLTPEQRTKWASDNRCPWLGIPAGMQPGPGGASSDQMYACPMHPEFVTEEANALCPKCNMKLVPVETKPDAAHHEHAAQGGGGMSGCPMMGH